MEIHWNTSVHTLYTYIYIYNFILYTYNYMEYPQLYMANHLDVGTLVPVVFRPSAR